MPTLARRSPTATRLPLRLPALLVVLAGLPVLARALLAALPHLFHGALRRLVAPPRCAACDLPTAPVAVFCPPCAAAIEPAAAEPDDLAFAAYGGPLAIAVRRFKYGSRPDLAHPLGHLLRHALREARAGHLFCEPDAAGSDLGDPCHPGDPGDPAGPGHDPEAPCEAVPDLVVPVPLHPRKLRQRGYNQAALLAAGAAAEIERPLVTGALCRSRDTLPQASLDRAGRLANLAAAFIVRRPAAVRGRHVLLVDDVCTTGATLRECRLALLAAGAARVTTLVLARADSGSENVLDRSEPPPRPSSLLTP